MRRAGHELFTAGAKDDVSCCASERRARRCGVTMLAMCVCAKYVCDRCASKWEGARGACYMVVGSSRGALRLVSRA